MRRFLWVLGATLILALLPLTGHIAFAAEHPQTAVTGASATTDNLAEATTDPAVAARSDHADHADRHDATGPAESTGATDGDNASSAGDETTDPRASRHAADDGGVIASDGDQSSSNQSQSDGDTGDQASAPPVASDQGSDPVAAPVTNPAPEPVTRPEASTGGDTGQTTEPSAPAATTASSDNVPSNPAPVAAVPATDSGNGDAGNFASSPASSPHPAPAAPPSPHPGRGSEDQLPLAQNSDRGPGGEGIVLPPAPLDLNRLIARLTAQGLCTPNGSGAGDLSCGGGAVQLCLRATATGVSLSCATPGGTTPGGSEHPGTNNPPPVTQPGGSEPGGSQPTESQPGGGSDPGSGAEPVASDPVASVSDLASGAEPSSDLASLSQPADAIEGGDPVVVGRPISFAPAGTGVSGPAAANVAALPAAPASSGGLSAASLNAVRKAPSLTNLMRPGNAYSAHLAPKLSVLSLVDHAPEQPQLPTLVVPRLPMLDPFAGLPAVAMSAGASQTAPHANSAGRQPVAAAPATGSRAVAAPAPLPVSHPAQSQQPSGTLDRSPSQPTGVWTGPLPNADKPSPVTPLRLLLVLLASGCFVAAAMTRSKRHRPRARAAPVPRRPGRLI